MRYLSDDPIADLFRLSVLEAIVILVRGTSSAPAEFGDTALGNEGQSTGSLIYTMIWVILPANNL